MRLVIPLFALLIGLQLSCQPSKKVDPKSDPTHKAQAKSPEKVVGITSKEALHKEIRFEVEGIDIIGDLYTLDKSAATIFLFHQARSNARGEYGTIIPVLTSAGYNVLAIDQRSGGDHFGSHNRTIANLDNKNLTYCQAYPDMVGALDYIIANQFNGLKFIWGSSYSAALVLQLANNRSDDVHAVLAFSPATGKNLEKCPANPNLQHLKMPVLMLRPEGEMDRESSKEQWALGKKFHHETYIASPSVHGSSMLVKERAGSSAADTWQVVLKFLAKIK